MAVGVNLIWCSDTTWALQRDVRTQIANYDSAPIQLHRASIELVQTYGAPGQFPLAAVDDRDAGVRRSQVRYMNRLNQQIPTFLLAGELRIRNHAPKTVEAFEVTTIFLNAFRERIGMERQAVTLPLAPHQHTELDWSHTLPHHDVFEAFFVITKVRFEDGTIWAPSEELILIP